MNNLDVDNNNLSGPHPDEIKDGQWLGVSVRSQGPGKKAVVCAHRFEELYFLFLNYSQFTINIIVFYSFSDIFENLESRYMVKVYVIHLVMN